eukprot:CAMPEP_0176409032 /NCGR_PEP_ID=MMETSP0127-20121128/2282_1 /TAXON_ID=938130 /ORGANISM="Platyophrya macrostoma, Strain WH" /LENGTH=361 /DNA_ID=CAMNT_0017788385 /DNA_START=41 /DNA_END=1126 /DNA_ORIENTATION=+
MAALPPIGSRQASVSPRRELVDEYQIKRRAHEARLQAEREAVLNEAAANAEAERQRKMEFRRDIVAQMDERKQFRESQRREEMSPARGGILQASGDDALNKRLAKQKAREALLESEKNALEAKRVKEELRSREREAEADLHRKIIDERREEMEKERARKKELSDAIDRQKRSNEALEQQKLREKLMKLQEERKMADDIARLAKQQQQEDEDRARFEKKLLDDANSTTAKQSGREAIAEKDWERRQRQEYEESERLRKKNEAEGKVLAREQFKKDLEDDAMKRTEFFKTHTGLSDSLRSVSPRLQPRSPRNNDTALANAAKAEGEVLSVKQQQLKKQQEYREALERQISEHDARRRLELTKR